MLAASPTQKRWHSLDAFRGLTIILMILVNSPGLPTTYSFLEHSPKDGCTLADLVFPFFIFIVGTSSVLALSGQIARQVPRHVSIQKILKRSLFLCCLGLALNAIPSFNWSHLRFPGVLQRIAVCYLCSSLLFLTTSKKTQMFLIVLLLLGYWLILIPSNEIIGKVDVWLFSPNHLYSPTFDPEGFLSSIPSMATALLGNLLGFILISRKPPSVRWLILIGVTLLSLGWGWSYLLPINKSLWTSSYVLWTAGMAYLTFAFFFQIMEVQGFFHWCRPLSLFGEHALFIYCLHVLGLKIQKLITIHATSGESLTLKTYLTHLLFHGLSPMNASMAYAITYTLFWYVFLLCYVPLKKNRHDAGF